MNKTCNIVGTLAVHYVGVIIVRRKKDKYMFDDILLVLKTTGIVLSLFVF